MSWRTQSQYQGLSKAQRQYMKEFDRQWDTKAMGRSRVDAFEHMGGLNTRSIPPIPLVASPSEFESDAAILEIKLSEFAGLLSRFTVPKRLRQGWSIHITLTCGRRVRAHFEDRAEANHAYATLQELSLIVTAS